MKMLNVNRVNQHTSAFLGIHTQIHPVTLIQLNPSHHMFWRLDQMMMAVFILTFNTTVFLCGLLL